MKTKALKIGYASIAAALLITSVPFVQPSKTKAYTYRTDYTIYGDVNGDKVIDSYDLIALNKKIINGNYTKICDLNCDEKINADDATLLKRYILGDRTVFDAYYNEDTDGDGLSDFSEIIEIGTDPDSTDTDNDGLSDYQELNKTKTSPFDKYSNGTNTSDGEFDSDGDGLSNTEEEKLKTDPLNEDTDYDGISDIDEVITYNTDPINYDSDSDTISDGDEVLLKLDPLKISSDGQTKDGDIIKEQEVSADSSALTDFNKKEASYDISVTVEAAGYAENNVIVDDSSYCDVIDNSFLACEPIDISYNKNLRVNSATINYTLNDNLLGNNNIEDYMLFKYYSDEQYLLPLKTYYNGKTIYTKDNELGTYCVCDINKYIKRMNESNVVKSDKSADCQVIFAVDLSSSSISSLDETCYSIISICDILFSITKQTSVYIYGYYWDTNDVPRAQRIGTSAMRDIEQVYTALANLEIPNAKSMNPIDGGIDVIYNRIVNEHIFNDNTPHRYAFVISNSDYSLTDRIQYKVAIPKPTVENLEELKDENIDLSIILSRENFKYKTAVDNLKTACKKFDFNVYSRTSSKLFISCACEKIYNDFLGSQRISYSGSMIPAAEKDKINYYDFIRSLPKSYDISKVPYPDSNGMIKTSEALAMLGATTINSNGLTSLPSLYSVCERKDITADGLDQLCEKISDILISNAIYVWSSIPLSPLTTDYIGSSVDDTSLEFKSFSSEYCYPPTNYHAIKPVNKSVQEERVNGETKNGKWVPWY